MAVKKKLPKLPRRAAAIRKAALESYRLIDLTDSDKQQVIWVDGPDGPGEQLELFFEDRDDCCGRWEVRCVTNIADVCEFASEEEEEEFYNEIEDRGEFVVEDGELSERVLILHIS